MEKGRVLALIGAAVGVLSVLLSLIIPALFSWYHIDETGGGEGLYLTAFGNLIEEGLSVPTNEILILVLVGGILVLAGAGLCIVGIIREMKPLGIIGGIVMIIGPTMLIFDLIGQVSEFAQYMENYASSLDKSIFFGSNSTYAWGLWVGYFLAYGGGILGLIGVALISPSN